MKGLLIATLIVLSVFLVVVSGGCRDREQINSQSTKGTDRTGNSDVAPDDLRLTYYGHSTFLLENGLSVLMDPYDYNLGYGKIKLSVDVVTISHNHSDHNYEAGGGSGAQVLRGIDSGGNWKKIEQNIKNARFYAVNSYHDDQSGALLGKNSIFVIETSGLRLAHLGDLGHVLDERALEQIGAIDVLMFPVGGRYTLSPADALTVITQIAPKVAIPMHYKTPHNEEDQIASLAEFLDMNLPFPVVKTGATLLEFNSKNLPDKTEIWTMSYVLP